MRAPEQAGLADLARTADRLRTVVSRWQARAEAPEPAVVRIALQELADLAADAEGVSRRPVPVLALHALPDQLSVLGRELLASGGSTAEAQVTATCRRLRDLAAPVAPGSDPTA